MRAYNITGLRTLTQLTQVTCPEPLFWFCGPDGTLLNALRCGMRSIFDGNIQYVWLVSEESFWLCAYLDERDEVAQCASSALVGRAYSALENSIRSLWLKAVSAQTPWDWVTQF